jgi:hypothetical protein
VKQREFTKIGKQLLPHLPGFEENKNVVFMTPVEDILRGVYFLASVDAGSISATRRISTRPRLCPDAAGVTVSLGT